MSEENWKVAGSYLNGFEVYVKGAGPKLQYAQVCRRGTKEVMILSWIFLPESPFYNEDDKLLGTEEQVCSFILAVSQLPRMS